MTCMNNMWFKLEINLNAKEQEDFGTSNHFIAEVPASKISQLTVNSFVEVPK